MPETLTKGTTLSEVERSTLRDEIQRVAQAIVEKKSVLTAITRAYQNLVMQKAESEGQLKLILATDPAYPSLQRHANELLRDTETTHDLLLCLQRELVDLEFKKTSIEQILCILPQESPIEPRAVFSGPVQKLTVTETYTVLNFHPHIRIEGTPEFVGAVRDRLALLLATKMVGKTLQDLIKSGKHITFAPHEAAGYEIRPDKENGEGEQKVSPQRVATDMRVLLPVQDCFSPAFKKLLVKSLWLATQYATGIEPWVPPTPRSDLIDRAKHLTKEVLTQLAEQSAAQGLIEDYEGFGSAG